jgi:hypothetical protein
MTVICCGRIAIVAVSNSFYAVPACLDVGSVKMTALSISGVPSNIASTLPNVEATKILAFGQSSQVHPVIAMEVMTSADCNASKTLNNEYLLKPITSLVFLASGRECTTLEIVSVPDPQYSVGKSGQHRIVPTNIESHPPRHGICHFASPILAAAALPKSSHASRLRQRVGESLTSAPLVALLTVDGLLHIRSPFCLSVPLSSMEVGTRPNDFFSVLALPGTEELGIVCAAVGGAFTVVGMLDRLRHRLINNQPGGILIL